MAENRSTAGAISHSGGSHIPVAGFVLAGGQSRRMGQDKASLVWRSQPLVVHMTRLLATAAAPVSVIGRDDRPDRIPHRGPLGGILTALELTETARNIIVAVDLPLLTPRFIEMFRARVALSRSHILACKIGSAYPLCVGVDRSLLSDVTHRVTRGDLAVQRFIIENDPEVLTEEELRDAGFPPDMFENINTPEDWARLSGL